MNNASGLLHKHFCDDRFINVLNISAEDDAMLRTARSKVRASIRDAFNRVRMNLRDLATEEQLKVAEGIKPKFMTQGSYAYKTLNRPCQGSQEIDLDDGVYLPMSFINSEPSANMELFFQIVDAALQQLAAREGWVFTNKKKTCSRLILPGKNAHIDIPLYAIPDKRHAQMSAVLKSMNFEHRFAEAVFHDDFSISRQLRLNEDEVYLAIRGEGWRKSDPLKIATWFSQETRLRGNESGKRLRRICRFLKAWRDYCWESGGPSSITLMACATHAYPDDDLDRDDYALQQVVSKLPELLAGEVLNPAEQEKEVLYPRGSMDTTEISTQALQLATCLNTALNHCNSPLDVISCFRQSFGDRIPNNAAWVISSSSAAEIVRNTKAKKVKPLQIPNTRAG